MVIPKREDQEMVDIKINGNVEPKGDGKKRYGPQEKLLILSQIDNKEKSIEDVSETYNIAIGTLKRWQKRWEKGKSEKDPLGLSWLGDACSKPKKFGNKLSVEKEEEILKCWKEHPGMGPSQIQFQLKREEGMKVSTRAIRRVLIEHGYEKKKKVGAGELQRFEAERPNKMWQMDIVETWINKCKVYVLLAIDDYSRFVVGHGTFTEANMGAAISVLRKAIARYGKPESFLTDRGLQFYSWKTMNRFQKLLEKLSIEHILARPHHPQTLGKTGYCTWKRGCGTKIYDYASFSSSLWARV